MMRMKQRLGVTLATALVLLPLMTPVAQAKTTSAAAMIKPHEAGYGYYVDTYRNNVKGNTTVTTNPSFGLLYTFDKIWSPTAGQKDPGLIRQSLDIAAKITQTRSQAEVKRSFLTDRRRLEYNNISGLGPYAAAFIKNADAKTDYYDVPAAPQPANTPYSKVTWANPDSKLGAMVQLIAATRVFGGTGVPKHFFKFIRPYRQDPQHVLPNPYLVNVMHAAKADDYDFPSGHTSAGFEIGEVMAYAFPERFQESVTRSSEIGYDRVLAGRHSPLAVMGGRMFGTAVAAATLNDPQYQGLMKRAYQEAHSDALLHSPLVTKNDDFGNYRTNQKNYRFRMTYGLPQNGDRTIAPRVPKGAEVLLATRLPYLSKTQRRMALATTELPSGYPVLDDTEGWGRLDLFSAANGYGALPTTTKVKMDAAKGGFNAHDTWRNDITGNGKLIKQGTGALTLKGHNQFKGGLQVDGGDLNLATATAAGNGQLTLNQGTLTANTAIKLQRGYQQTKRGTLALTVTKATAMKIRGKAKLAGTLRLTNLKGLKSHQTVITFDQHQGKFSRIVGLPKGWHAVYTAHKLALVRN